jgi:predicted pyridoxine 5'-phosphate oxidase superfamily flavin-nucleotide-binding protein
MPIPKDRSGPSDPTAEEAFHAGERALQARTGSREQLAEFGAKIFRDAMPGAHRELFEKLPFMAIGALDAEGRPWAEMIAGRPGFVQSPDARTLRIAGRPASQGLLANLDPGALVGLLGIELPTRRRNRVNGEVVSSDASELVVRVHQSFGNCPKYIQVRRPELVEAASANAAWRPEGPRLSAVARALVQRADTFFIVSSTPDAKARPAIGSSPQSRSSGLDVSHRGGKPGFVRVSSGEADALTFPDFTGNFFFNTLGNLALEPRAGLYFPDFATGDALSLTGRAEVIWEGPELEAFRGAERLVRFVVEAGWFGPGSLPLRSAGAPKLAPQLEDTGSWEEVERLTGGSAYRTR